MGDYLLTVVDSLDTFPMLDDKAGFEQAVREVIEHVSFDVDSRVQVFEVTIRMMGGLVRCAHPPRAGVTFPDTDRLPGSAVRSPVGHPARKWQLFLVDPWLLLAVVQRRAPRPRARLGEEVAAGFRHADWDSLCADTPAERSPRGQKRKGRERRDLQRG